MNKNDIDLILHWFEHIEQLATDRKTQTGHVMCYSDTLDEIRCFAIKSQMFIKNHYLQEVKIKQSGIACDQRINDFNKLLNSIFKHENM